MWFFVISGVFLLVVALAGGLRIVPPTVGLISLVGFFFCVGCALLLGYQSRRVAMEDRQRGAAGTMLVLMAGMLKNEDDETLEKIAARGGPAGDAASMLLLNRRIKSDK
jgi:hypothetical protein